jgi:hypothetical protein
MWLWLLSYRADGELRICIPMSDVIHGQVDEGVKLLLDTGGEVAQRYLTVEMNRFPLAPFVIVFTKFDLASSSRNDYEDSERCLSLFENVPAEIVSSIYYFACVAYKDCLTPLFLARAAWPRFRDLIDKLVQTTDRLTLAHYSRGISAPFEAQGSQPRLSPVSLAWSVSQRASRDINIKTAIE